MAAGTTALSPGNSSCASAGKPGDVERTEAKHADTARDILHRLFAPVGKGERKPVANLLIGVTRDAQTSRLAQGLKPRSDVHTIAEYVTAFDDYVTDLSAGQNHAG
jgi:hypothetical protein